MLTPMILAVCLLTAPFSMARAHNAATQSPAVTAGDVIPTSLFIKEKPKDSQDIRESKTTAKVGDKITLNGRVGGRKEPFVKSRSMFILADRRLVACDEKADDHCKTPWDFCCDTPETIKANTVTIQIVGADKKPLKVSAENAGGLKTLSKVTVVGTVREITKNGAFVVDAEQIYVEPVAAKP